MDADDRELLLTAAWMFARHGQTARARRLCAALAEALPGDALVQTALAELSLQDGDAAAALAALRRAHPPPELERAAALLEARALAALGRTGEAEKRWRRHLEAAKGATRRWI